MFWGENNAYIELYTNKCLQRNQSATIKYIRCTVTCKYVT